MEKSSKVFVGMDVLIDRRSRWPPPRSLSGSIITIHPPRAVGRTNSSPLTKKAISTSRCRRAANDARPVCDVSRASGFEQ